VGEDGASAQSIEDFALMSSLPPFRVVVPADAYSVEKAIRAAAATPGPFYIRTHRPETPVVYSAADCPFELGKANMLREGRDAAIIAVGLLVHEAVQAADRLKAVHGVSCRVLDMHTLKPIDEAAVLAASRDTGAIVTAEEHQVHGGLGATVARVLADKGDRFTPVDFVALHGYGTSGKYPDIMAHFGLTADEIEKRVLAILKRKR
jgi:transketolase